MSERILVVDDDPGMIRVARMDLEKEGYKVVSAEDADDALKRLRGEDVDLILLDVELPGASGFQLLESIRQDEEIGSIPVIMLTVRGEERDKLKGLKTGADDYLVKPFSRRELLARIEAVLRRARNSVSASRTLACGPLRLDPARSEAWADGKRIRLRPMEFRLLCILLERKGFVIAFQALIDGLAQDGRKMTPDNLYFHVNRLRAALGAHKDLIQTVQGKGYKLSES